jgi:hypothetical protein
MIAKSKNESTRRNAEPRRVCSNFEFYNIKKITLQYELVAHRGGAEVCFYPFLNIDFRWGWVLNVTPRPLPPFTGEETTVHIPREAEWVLDPV